MSDQQLVFIDVPLLFESGMDQYMDQVWLVDADDEVRILRVMDRDGSSREEVLNRIRYQLGRDEKKEKAHFILDNSGVKGSLYNQIDKILNILIKKENI